MQREAFKVNFVNFRVMWKFRSFPAASVPVTPPGLWTSQGQPIMGPAGGAGKYLKNEGGTK